MSSSDRRDAPQTACGSRSPEKGNAQNARDGLVDDAPPAELLAALATVAKYLARTRREESDELVKLDAATLAVLGVELRAVQALVRAGRLRAVKIGRSTFTTRRRLLALVDELPPVQRSRASADDAQGDGDESDDADVVELRALAAKASRRRSA